MSDVEDNEREPPVAEMEHRTWARVIFGETLEDWITRIIIVVLINASVENATPVIKWIAGFATAIVFGGVLLMVVIGIRQARRHAPPPTDKRI